MSSAYALSLETTILVQASFISAAAFLLLYTLWHNWWSTLHGAALGALSLGVIIVLLRPVLYYWHVFTSYNYAVLSALSQECSDDMAHHYTHAMQICEQAVKATQQVPDVGEWITIQALLFLPLAFLVLIYQLIRKNRAHGDGTITGSQTERHLTDSR